MSRRVTGFDGHCQIKTGSLSEVARAVRLAEEGGARGPLLVFDDETGRVVDLEPTVETSASDAGGEVVGIANASGAEDSTSTGADQSGAEPRKRGRPKLGVVAREVTLLPRHWEWLNAQPGGPSVALRKLVDEARRASAGRDREREAREAAYRFIHAIAGDFPGFEEVTRALFAGDSEQFYALMGEWPNDVRDYAARLLAADGTELDVVHRQKMLIGVEAPDAGGDVGNQSTGTACATLSQRGS